MLECAGAFEYHPRQIETNVEQAGAVAREAPLNGLVVPGVDPR